MRDDLVPFALERAPAPHLAWAEGRTFLVPRDARAGRAGRLRELRAFTDRKPASSRLPFSYQNVPAPVRDQVARALGRFLRPARARWARFPRWPLDLSADLLADLDGVPSPFRDAPAPVLLTHDLDSPEGLESFVRRFHAIEERAGARSTSFVVPNGWPLDHGLLGEVRARGHELGIHGHDHGNRTPFLPEEERRRRHDAARSLVERYGMTGYRAPSLLRTRALLRDLAPRFGYDASIPTSGGPFPVPNNGCASARPFRIEGIWEIPLSLPRDGSLLFLGHAPRAIAALWQRIALEIARSGGVVVLLTHCEERFSGSRAMLEAYERFLDFVASSERLRFATTAEVLRTAAGS